MEKFFELLKESLKDTSGKWIICDLGSIRFMNLNLIGEYLPPTCPIEQTSLTLRGIILDNLPDMGKDIGLTVWETIQIVRAADNAKNRPEFDPELRQRILNTLNLKEPENVP